MSHDDKDDVRVPAVYREAWAVEYPTRIMGSPTFDRKEAEANMRRHGGVAVRRFVLVRPKRKTVAWLVKYPGGTYAAVYEHPSPGWTTTHELALAHRFSSKKDACAFRDERYGGRVVRLVKSTKGGT